SGVAVGCRRRYTAARPLGRFSYDAWGSPLRADVQFGWIRVAAGIRPRLDPLTGRCHSAMAPSPPTPYLPPMRPEELEPLQTRDAATESDLAGLIDREFAVVGERRAASAARARSPAPR